MKEKNRYQLFSLAFILLFVYLCAAEVYDRWEGALAAWSDLNAREATLANPDKLEEKRMILSATKRTLLAEATKASGKYEQNETGIFEYLSHNAKEHGFKYRSVEPGEMKTQGEMRELGFKLSFSTGYITAGKWLSDIESGAIPIKLTKLEMATENVFSSKLNIDLAGKAYLFPRVSDR